MGKKRIAKLKKALNAVISNLRHVVYIQLHNQWFVFTRESELGDSDQILQCVISGDINNEKDLSIFDNCEDASKKAIEVASRENILLYPYIFYGKSFLEKET